MSRDAGDSRKAKIGDAGSPVPVDQDVRLGTWTRCKYGAISLEKNLYPFKISVDDTEVMHILQAIRNAGQLNSTSISYLRDRIMTYQFSAVHVPIPPDELSDVPMFHPL